VGYEKILKFDARQLWLTSVRFYSSTSSKQHESGPLTVDDLKMKFSKYNQPNYVENLIAQNPAMSKLKRASVLIPISLQEVKNENGDVQRKSFFTFSKRTDSMSSFKGEVCFLGGKKDNSESDLETAYREAREEANLQADSLVYLGQLCPIITFNQVLVTPIIAYFDKAKFEPILNETEVEIIFDLPTERFLSDVKHKVKIQSNESGEYYIHYFKDTVDGRSINTWGFTAFLSIVVSSLLHGRKPAFKLTPYDHHIDDNLNDFLQMFVLRKLAVSETHYKNKKP
jgi:8-oxo-dGTP pyrophosphatase MutT (NUDIX family)